MDKQCINDVSVGERIRKLRDKKGCKSYAYAQLLGISACAYSRYENGERRLPLEIAVAIADKYDVTLDYIYRGATTSKEEMVRIGYALRGFSPQQRDDALKNLETYCATIRKANMKK